MRHNLFTRIVSLLLLPLFLISQVPLPAMTIQSQEHHKNCNLCQVDPSSIMNFTFDDFVAFLNDLENGNLEETCSEEDLFYIMRLIVDLARKGIPKDDWYAKYVLEQDIQTLFQDDDSDNDFMSTDPTDSSFIPSISQDRPTIIQCKHHKHKDGDKHKGKKHHHHDKGWWHKRWDECKNFCKKHKTECIIGGIVVAAVTIVVVCATGGAAAPAVAALGAAAASSADSSDSKHDPDKNTITIAEVTEEQINQQKASIELACVPKDDSEVLAQKAKEITSHLAHEAWNAVTEVVSVVPETFQEVGDVASKFLSGNSDLLGSPKENFDNIVAEGHELIDRVFDTDQAIVYSSENHHRDDFVYGMLPPPTLVGKSCGSFSSTKIVIDQQTKHIPGSWNYIAGKGKWTHPDSQALLDKYAGKGQKITGEPGMPGYRERVDFGEIIGYYIEEGSNIELPTTKGIIHYSKKGAHIVPADPR